jgi:hypothetical protein
LAIASEAYGAEHPKTATSHVNLGRVLRALGNPDEARREIEAALRIYAEGSPDRAAAQAELDALN